MNTAQPPPTSQQPPRKRKKSNTGTSAKPQQRHRAIPQMHQHHSQQQAQQQMQSQSNMFSSAWHEERDSIYRFWQQLDRASRQRILVVDKSDLLHRMKEQSRLNQCHCDGCTRRRNFIDDELEQIYDHFYRQLCFSHRPPDVPADVAPKKGEEADMSRDLTILNRSSVPAHSQSSPRHVQWAWDEFDDHFDNTLQPIQDGKVTVADQLLANGGLKFLLMMEHLSLHDLIDFDEDEDADTDSYIESADESIDNDDYSEEDYVLSEDEEDDSTTSEDHLEESRRMFQIFTAKILEERVLQAFFERVAAENQEKFLRELEEEKEKEQLQEQKRKQKKQVQKDRKKTEKMQRELERIKREQAEEEKRREEEVKRKEAIRVEQERLELERKRLEAEAEEKRKALEEEKAKLEESKKKKKSKKPKEIPVKPAEAIAQKQAPVKTVSETKPLQQQTKPETVKPSPARQLFAVQKPTSAPAERVSPDSVITSMKVQAPQQQTKISQLSLQQQLGKKQQDKPSDGISSTVSESELMNVELRTSRQETAPISIPKHFYQPAEIPYQVQAQQVPLHPQQINHPAHDPAIQMMSKANVPQFPPLHTGFVGGSAIDLLSSIPIAEQQLRQQQRYSGLHTHSSVAPAPGIPPPPGLFSYPPPPSPIDINKPHNLLYDNRSSFSTTSQSLPSFEATFNTNPNLYMPGMNPQHLLNKPNHVGPIGSRPASSSTLPNGAFSSKRFGCIF